MKLVFAPATGLLVRGLPAGLQGLVLPGGSDMCEVEPQIAAACAADLPTLGLCLGIQSMATMALRDAGDADAALEEVAVPGLGPSFVRLPDADTPWHRLGELSCVPSRARGSRRSWVATRPIA